MITAGPMPPEPVEDPKEPQEITSLLAYRAKLQADVDKMTVGMNGLRDSIARIDQAVELLRADSRLVPFVQTILDAARRLKITG